MAGQHISLGFSAARMPTCKANELRPAEGSGAQANLSQALGTTLFAATSVLSGFWSSHDG